MSLFTTRNNFIQSSLSNQLYTAQKKQIYPEEKSCF